MTSTTPTTANLTGTIPPPPPPEITTSVNASAAAPDSSLILWDIPFAPSDDRKTRRMRASAGLGPEIPRRSDAEVEMQSLLDKIIPPRIWVDDDGTTWEQHASTQRSVLLDAVTLEERLRDRMEFDGARDTGICPIRRELYNECLSELCRQVMTEERERGLFLLKLRAEREGTIAAYRDLYESRMAFAARMAMKGDKESVRTTADIARLKEAKTRLLRQEEQLREECELATQRGDEVLKDDEKKNKDEITALNKEGTQKRTQLELLTAPVKKY
eukprot:PhM_4_TR7317/c0_g1_i1/m.88003/K10410/DNALI; dynein light intermediate chain, axonemal